MTVRITEAGLRKIAPGASNDIVSGIIAHQNLLPKYGIDTHQRVAMFFGQVACETQGLTRLEENLYYTTAKRLMQVWPSRFKSVGAATPFLRNPRKLANNVYGGRLGNNKPDDGWLYRGSGCKNTTGKYNFGIVQKVTGLPVVAKPEMLRRFPEALESACIYWKTNNLNRFADAGSVTGLTKAVQGGSGGLSDRRIYTDRALRVDWGASADAPVPHTNKEERTLRIGDHGPTVKIAQERLLDHGYEIMTDGVFGPGTENIVREFQEANGLMPDGVVGPNTWAALKKTPEPAEPDIAPAATGFIALIVEIIARLFNVQR